MDAITATLLGSTTLGSDAANLAVIENAGMSLGRQDRNAPGRVLRAMNNAQLEALTRGQEMGQRMVENVATIGTHLYRDAREIALNAHVA